MKAKTLFAAAALALASGASFAADPCEPRLAENVRITPFNAAVIYTWKTAAFPAGCYIVAKIEWQPKTQFKDARELRSELGRLDTLAGYSGDAAFMVGDAKRILSQKE